MPDTSRPTAARRTTRMVALAACAATAVGALLPPAAAAPPAGVGSPGVALDWGPCPPGDEPDLPVTGTYQCATAAVPLDHARPGGDTIDIAIKRRLADDSASRLGSLFVNPGGPGASGVDFVPAAEFLYPPEVLARFDVVGFDPRGVARSTPLICFDSVDEVDSLLAPLPAFPVSPSEDRAFAAALAEFSRRCAELSAPVMPHMSTANVARDLDLLREAVGDPQLTYAGYSYGTQLGTTYANLFPERVRALVLDGVLDPVAWTTGRDPLQGRLEPFSTRLRSDEGASASLHAFFAECRAVGPPRCSLADGDPQARFDRLAVQLLVQPVEVEVEPGVTVPLGYADLVSVTLGALYDPASWPDLARFLDEVSELRDPRAAGLAYRELREGVAPAEESTAQQTLEGLTGVACADSDNPRHWQAWSANGWVADVRAPYFGRPWTWISAACATWPARDAGRYTGPWTAQTTGPVLVVGNRYDPATRYEGALTVNRLLPGSRLLTMEGYGHVALGQSACVDAAVAAYLVDGTLPAAGSACRPDVGPFEDVGALTADPVAEARQAARRQLLDDVRVR